MKCPFNQLRLATTTDLKGYCRVADVPMETGTFAQAGHAEKAIALWTSVGQ